MILNYFKRICLSAIAAAALFGCSYDDSDLKNRVDDLDTRLTEIESTVKDINNNISSLMATVSALEKQLKIVSVNRLEDETGYVVKFSDGSEITIINGKDGEDGTDGDTPVIGVRMDADGIYYWTVNGDYLYDNGSKIPATSRTQVPQIRVENGNFELSFDGDNWEVIGTAGSAGIFKDVQDGADSVTFILSNGQTIVIPKVQEFALNISKAEFPVTPGGQLSIPYTISAADEGTAISVLATEGFKASVHYNFANDVSSGNILVEIPNPLTDGKVFVFAVNSKGTPSARILSFEQGSFMAMEMGATNIPAEGGDLMVYVQTNYDYNVVIPEDAQSWISYSVTKAVRDEFLNLTIAANKEASPRSAEIKLRDDNYVVYHTIPITQEAGSGEKEAGYYNSIDDWEYDGSLQF